MQAKALVSIVMPAYNCAGTIAESLDSCLAQTYVPLEIIVVDDGSDDETVAIVQAYGEQVRLIQQENQGPGIARNTGILAAKGEFVKFCDSDDILAPQHLEKVMTLFASLGDVVGVVYTRYQHVQADGKSPVPNKKDPELLAGEIFCDLLRSNSNAILTSAVTVRRTALLAVGNFPDDKHLRHSEDWDLFLRLAATYQYANVPEILLNYRWHDENISNDAYAVARGRLIVWQRARNYAPRQTCMSDAEFSKIEAGRYHVLAMHAWKVNKLQEARQALMAAIKIYPSLARRLYYFLSYFAPYSMIRWLTILLEKAKA